MSKKIAGAFARDDDGREFLVVHVDRSLVDDPPRANRILRELTGVFEMPVVLASQVHGDNFSVMGPTPLLNALRRRGGPASLDWGHVRVPSPSLWQRTTVLSMNDLWQMLKGE